MMDAQAIYMYQNPNDSGPRGTQRPNQNGGGGANGNNGGKRDGTSLLMRGVIIVVVLLLAYWVFTYFTSSSTNANSGPNIVEVPYSTYYQQVQNNNVKNAVFQGQDVTGSFITAVTVTDASGTSKTGTQYHFTQLPDGDQNLIALLNAHHVQYYSKPANDGSVWQGILFGLLPWVLVFGVFILIARRATQSQQNIFSFGKSKAKVILEDKPTTTFADVAGVDEAKNDLVEVVEFLKTPGKFQRLGGKIPRGVLLVGPPGTGKTLLARAVAGEASVPFFSMSGSEFVEVLVGVGASRVRDLFDQAKKAAPSIIFIDEIDAVGKQRGSSD